MLPLKAMTQVNEEKINEILTRGTEDVFVKDHLEEALKSGKKLRVKHGIDPTGPAIHLGRASTLRKVKAFQDAGHHIVLVVGDFTARIGDPSDKLEKRPMLSREDVEENMRGYEEQLGKIIDLDRAEVRYNSEWLEGLRADEIMELAESFTVGQMSARRNFKERIEKGQEISVREFLYPLMQGYDSFAVRADVEVGGFDQLFNVKAGRIIQKHYGQPEQDILTTQMLEGTDGRKMTTTWGNVINIIDEPNDIFGKIMAVNDELIEKYFILSTDIPEKEIKEIISGHPNPRDQKIILAKEIVQLYHGDTEAGKAEEYFISTFSKKEVPDDMPEIRAEDDENIIDMLARAHVASSKSELRRLAKSGGVHDLESGETITDLNIKIEKPRTLKIGKKKFIKVLPKE